VIIGGLEKFSLCDFPGQTAAVVFTRGCNFRCGYCHNRDLISSRRSPATDLDEDAVMRFLEKRRGILSGVVICGGEPTLQADLIPFLELLRRMGFRNKLDTNGSRPEQLRAALEGNLLDFVAMDIKAPWAKYDHICGTAILVDDVRRSMNLILESGIPYEFRTTWSASLFPESELRRIRDQLPEGAVHKIQKLQQTG